MNRRAPSELLLWLLARLSWLDQFVMGDILEQYSQGRSVWWFWRQVFGEIVIRSIQTFFQGRDAMKRMTASMLVLLGVFLFGFWAGRSPLLMRVDPPPRLYEIPIARPLRLRAEKVYGTVEFLQMELQKAREQNAREKTAESKRQVENLESKLVQAKLAATIEESKR